MASEGIVLSIHMAQRLGVGVGGLGGCESDIPGRTDHAGACHCSYGAIMGTTAYMSMEGLADISEYRNVCTGLYIKAASGAEELIWKDLEGAPQVTGLKAGSPRSRNGEI